MLKAYKSHFVSKQQHPTPLYMCWGGGGLSFNQHCNIALIALHCIQKNKRYLLLKKCGAIKFRVLVI
jgi:hypothetical protein